METIRVYDAAHGHNEMHRYTRTGGKEPGGGLPQRYPWDIERAADEGLSVVLVSADGSTRVLKPELQTHCPLSSAPRACLRRVKVGKT